MKRGEEKVEREKGRKRKQPIRVARGGERGGRERRADERKKSGAERV